MPEEEQLSFFDTMANLKVPTRYASRLKKDIVKGRLGAMKSHDYHVLFQQILPISLRHKMSKELRIAIIRICRVFKVKCNKVYDLVAYPMLKFGTIIVLCHLEKVFPPSFFDLMTHLVIHLVHELDICGLVHTCGCIQLNVP
jgi:hypothetical protein